MGDPVRLIGVTQRVVVDPHHGERRDALDQRWPVLLAEAGLGAVSLPNTPELAIELASAVQVAGVLLTGGNDLAAYGGDTPERDATEAALLAWARKRQLPVLGVCRGMQIIQHNFGVPLEQAEGHVTASHDAVVAGAPRAVNSYHHYLARTSVPGLRIWATAWDGGVEAVKHEHEPIVGVMWHPERCAPFDARDLALLRSHFGAA